MMRKNFILTVATLVARNSNEAMVGSGVVCVCLESDRRFCEGAFGMNLVSVAVNMFSHLIYFIKIFYTFCTSNAICKDNVAINCSAVQHKKKVQSRQF
jgi:hypothetical protein